MLDDPAARGEMPEKIVTADRTDCGGGDDHQERDRRDASRHCAEYKALRARNAGWGRRGGRGGGWCGWRAVVDRDVAVHGADLQRILPAIHFTGHATRAGMRVNVQ